MKLLEDLKSKLIFWKFTYSLRFIDMLFTDKSDKPDKSDKTESKDTKPAG